MRVVGVPGGWVTVRPDPPEALPLARLLELDGHAVLAEQVRPFSLRTSIACEYAPPPSLHPARSPKSSTPG